MVKWANYGKKEKKKKKGEGGEKSLCYSINTLILCFWQAELPAEPGWQQCRG